MPFGQDSSFTKSLSAVINVVILKRILYRKIIFSQDLSDLSLVRSTHTQTSSPRNLMILEIGAATEVSPGEWTMGIGLCPEGSSALRSKEQLANWPGRRAKQFIASGGSLPR